jgi:hypothetical protein
MRPDARHAAPPVSPIGAMVSLDQLFRSHAAAHPDRLALTVVGPRPQAIAYAALDREAQRLAAVFTQAQLPRDAVVMVALDPGLEQMATLLALWRAGLVAALCPPLWRKADLVRATERLAARAIVTAEHAHGTQAALLMRDVAAECFTVRFVLAFGDEVPDGIVPLSLGLAEADTMPVPEPAEDQPLRPAFVTFDAGPAGSYPVARNSLQAFAAGLALVQEAGLAAGATLYTVLSPASLAGLSSGILPWLLTGGTLVVDPDFDAARFAATLRGLAPLTFAAPGALVQRVGWASLDAGAVTAIAVWRAPERAQSAAAQASEAGVRLVDLLAFGEAGLVVRRRATQEAAGLPLGVVHAGLEPGAPPLLEALRNPRGQLALRGAMVPQAPFPPGAERGDAPVPTFDAELFLDTGHPCRHDRTVGRLVLDGPVAGLATIGGVRLSLAEAQAMLEAVAPGASLAVVPDSLLGSRLIGIAENRSRTAHMAAEAGLHPLIIAAFRARRAEAPGAVAA